MFTISIFLQPGTCQPQASTYLVSKIVSVRTFVCVCICVCPPLRLLITRGVIWTHMISSIAVMWQLKSISLKGVVLEFIPVVEINPAKVS